MAIFNSYVKLPEGITLYNLEHLCQGGQVRKARTLLGSLSPLVDVARLVGSQTSQNPWLRSGWTHGMTESLSDINDIIKNIDDWNHPPGTPIGWKQPLRSKHGIHGSCQYINHLPARFFGIKWDSRRLHADWGKKATSQSWLVQKNLHSVLACFSNFKFSTSDLTNLHQTSGNFDPAEVEAPWHARSDCPRWLLQVTWWQQVLIQINQHQIFQHVVHTFRTVLRRKPNPAVADMACLYIPSVDSLRVTGLPSTPSSVVTCCTSVPSFLHVLLISWVI